MKVTYNWLKQYVDFTWPPDELAERLTMLGIEVEGVQKLNGEFEGIVVGEVITRGAVPGSDKLSVCRVNDGKGERQIICGASNFKPGDKVALILPNCALPLKPGEKDPFVIKVRKVMGVESHGMMCSPKELGLAEDAEGILILRDDAKVGQPFAEYLGRALGDVVYDLEITPNRPDLNSVLGIAREISALTGHPLRLPAVDSAPYNSAPEFVLRPRYPRASLPGGLGGGARRGFRALSTLHRPRRSRRQDRTEPGLAPAHLGKVGIRSINNVVDVTNYVMMEVGQPLHASTIICSLHKRR